MKKIISIIMCTIIILLSIQISRAEAHNITWNETSVNNKKTAQAYWDTNAGFNYKKGYNLNVIKADSKYAFCLEPTVLLKHTDDYTTAELDYRDPYLKKVAIAKWINFDKKAFLGENYNKDKRDGLDYSITQFLIWKMGGQSVDINAWFGENLIRDYIESGVYEVEKWDVWPSYIGKIFEVNKGDILTFDQGTEGKEFYTDANDVKINVVDSKDYPTDTNDRYTNVINRFKQKLIINIGENAPKEFKVYVSQENPVVQKLMAKEQSPLIYRSAYSQNLMSGGFVKNDVKSFTIKVKSKSILIKKSDEENKKISGVKFLVAKDNNFKDIIQEVITDINGEARIDNLVDIEKVYIKEIEAPKPYLIKNEVKEIVLDKEVNEVEFVNSKIHGKIKIIKTHKKWNNKNNFIEEDVKLPEQDVIFDILDSQNKVVETLKTDANGIATSGDLPYGKYKIIQKSLFQGTKESKELEVTVNENNKIYNVNIENENIKSKIKIIKIDEDGNIVPIKGIKFQILDVNKSVLVFDGIKEFETDEKGIVKFDYFLPYGTYYIKEIFVPNNSGYVINNEPYKIFVDGKNDEVEVRFKNKRQKGKIVLDKVGENISELISIDKLGYEVVEHRFNDKPLKKVKFEIQGEDGYRFLGETDDNGRLEIDNLKLGKYKIVEIETQKDYILNKKPINVELNAENSNIEIVKKSLGIKNNRKKVKIKLNKKIENSDINDDYKNIAFDEIIFGLYSKNDTEYYRKDMLLDVSKLDKNFEASFNIFQDGNYYIKELNTGKMYEIDKEYKDISVDYENIHDESTILVESINKIKRANIKIIKSEAHTSKSLEGIEFNLLDENGNLIKKGNTDKNGSLIFENIEYGTYTLKETPIDGYLNIEPFIIDVNGDEKELLYEVKNEKIPIIKSLAKIEGEKETHKTGIVSITDEIKIEDIIPNTEYELTAKLIDKHTGNIILIDGKEASKTIALNSDSSKVEAKIEFYVDITKVDTENIVIFDELKRDGKIVSTHDDIENSDQTIFIRHPSIETYATINNEKVFKGDGIVEIVDEVRFRSLFPGKEYELRGVLIDKKSGKPLIVNNEEVVAKTKFIPEDRDGVVHLKFNLDTSSLESKEIVLYDTLYNEDNIIFEHADINNEKQTVIFEVPHLPPTGISGEVSKYFIAGIISLFILSTLVKISK